MCRYLVALLDQRNCEIAVEQNGEDAIRRAASFQPDVALIGFVMPGIEGSTTGVGLLKVSPLTNVVFITEFVSPEILENLMAHGYHFKTLPAPFEFATGGPVLPHGGRHLNYIEPAQRLLDQVPSTLDSRAGCQHHPTLWLKAESV